MKVINRKVDKFFIFIKSYYPNIFTAIPELKKVFSNPDVPIPVSVREESPNRYSLTLEGDGKNILSVAGCDLYVDLVPNKITPPFILISSSPDVEYSLSNKTPHFIFQDVILTDGYDETSLRYIIKLFSNCEDKRDEIFTQLSRKFLIFSVENYSTFTLPKESSPTYVTRDFFLYGKGYSRKITELTRHPFFRYMPSAYLSVTNDLDNVSETLWRLSTHMVTDSNEGRRFLIIPLNNFKSPIISAWGVAYSGSSDNIYHIIPIMRPDISVSWGAIIDGSFQPSEDFILSLVREAIYELSMKGEVIV